MAEILRMRNPIQHYAWGSHEVLARLQGRPVPSPEPEAELWVGAHPGAPSVLVRDGRDEPLEDLPFLLKILAIDAPLSIQVHPSPEQAVAGFEREERAGIPRDDPRRNYKDRSAKPETVVALTGMELLTGAQPADRLRTTAARLGLDWLRAVADRRGPVLPRVLALDDDDAGAAVAATVAAARAAAPGDPVAALVRHVHDRHPGDRGLLVALCMHHVLLAPGQSLHTPAGQLHAYLCGTAIEVMSSSDNVLRAGLTGKHVDVPELLAVLADEQAAPGIADPPADEDGRRGYQLWDERLSLAAHELVPGRTVPVELRGTTVLLSTGDRAVLRTADREWELGGGESLLHRGGSSIVELTGEGQVFTVSCR